MWTQLNRNDAAWAGNHGRLVAAAGFGLGIMAIALSATPALADADHGMPQFAFGEPGHIDDVDRTIEIEAGDVYFKPTSIEVKSGESIRFVITDTGNVVHDFTIGNAATQEDHRAEMTNMMNMGVFDAMFMSQAVGHQDWNAMMLNPGERRVMVWKFGAPGTLEYGCNVPGHYESGMHGTIVVQP